MGGFSELDARGLGPRSKPPSEAEVDNGSSRSDFERRAVVGLAGERALTEHFEAQGWSVSCPVQNNSDRFVNAEPGFLLKNGIRCGLDRKFVLLTDANEWVMANSTPAFRGKSTTIFAPDLRLDKPGRRPRLIKVKTATWLSL